MKCLQFIFLITLSTVCYSQSFNDDCATATLLQVSSGGVSIAPNFSNASQTVGINATKFFSYINANENFGGEINYTGRDVWYRLNTGEYNVIESYFDVLQDCLTPLSSNSGREYYEPYSYSVTPFTDYYILVREVAVESYSGIDYYPSYNNYYYEFISLSNEPSNTSCATAETIPQPLIGQTIYINDVSHSGRFDKFYSITPTTDIIVEAQLEFEEDCSDGSFFSSEWYSIKSMLSQGITYYASFSSSRGPIAITGVHAPSNGTCSASDDIELDEFIYFDPDFYDDQGEGPLQNNGNPVAYYNFVAPATGVVQLSGGEYGENVFVYDDCLSPVHISSTNAILNSLIPGTTYLLAINESESMAITVNEIGEVAANDECDDATSVIADGSIIPYSFLLSESLVTQSEVVQNFSQHREVDNDLWYQCSAVSSGIVAANFFDVDIDVWKIVVEGDCTSIVPFGDKWTRSGQYNVPIGEDFLLRVYSNSSLYEGSIELEELDVETPAVNDLCSNATTVALGTLYDLDYMLDATYTSISGDCTVGNDSRDLWFSYESEEDLTIRVQGASIVTFYEGVDCNTLELITCNANRDNIRLQGSTSYYFRVMPIANTQNSTFQIVSNSSQIHNCDDALELSLLSTYISANSNGYAANGLKGSCWDNRSSAAWFEFTTSMDAYVLNIKDNNIGYSIFNGTCDALTEIYCTGSNSLDDVVELLPNTNYKLYSEDGSIRYSITGPVPSENDCTGALDILIDEDWQTIEASYELLTRSGLNNANCHLGNDYWLSFTVPSSGIIECKSDQSSNRKVTLYSDCNSSESLACERLDNGPISFQNLNPGATMLLRSDAVNSTLQIRGIGDAQSNGTCIAASMISSDDCATSYSGNSYNNSEGVWYNITMPDSEHLLLIKQEEFDFDIYFGSSYGSLTQYFVEDVESPSVYGISSGTSIYINILPDQTFNFCCSDGPAITYGNQVCQDSEEIGSLILNNCLSLDLEVSPVSGDGILGNNISNERIEVWYECTMIGENIDVNVENFSFFNSINTSVSIYDDCNGDPLDNIPLDGSPKTIRGLTIGSALYIKIESSVDPNISTSCDPSDAFYNNCIQSQFNASSFNIDLCIKALPMPAINDICEDAIALVLSDGICNNEIADHTIDAYDDKYNCRPASRELFYSYTPSETQSVEVTLSNASIPMTLSYYEGGCTSSERGCTDNSLQLTLNQDVEYLFAVSPLDNSSNSDFSICIKEIISEGSEDNIGVNVSNPIQPFHVNGAIAVGNNDLAFPGSIRYTGADFEGATQDGWKSLTQGQSQQNIGDDLGSHTATQPLNMSDNRVTDLLSPIAPNDATNKSYVDQQISSLNTELQRVTSLIPATNTETTTDPFSFGGESGSDNLGNHIADRTMNLSNNRITNLAGPISNKDAVPKEYVDNLATILAEQISDIQVSSQGNINQNATGNGALDNLGNHSATQQLNMADNQIRNLPSPIAPDNAANKEYVDLRVESVENSIIQLNSEENVESDLIENITLDGYYNNGQKFNLDVQTNRNSFLVDVSNLYNGWTYERNGTADEVFTEDIDVIIDTKLQLNKPSLTRFVANSGNVMDVSSEGINFRFDLYYLNEEQYSPLFQIGSYLEIGNEPSFNFEPDQALLGIGTIASGAKFHISHSGSHDFIKLEKSGTVKTVFNNDGYLGVGVVDPQKEIDVDGGIQITTNSTGSAFQLNLIENNDGLARLNMTNSSGKDITFAAEPSATTANSRLHFYIEDAGNVMTLSGSERVGINNTSPDYTLDVEAEVGDNPFRVGRSNASETYIKVLDNGDVGIGGDPSADLHLNHSNSGSSGGFRLENKSANASQYWRMYVSSSTNDLRLYSGTSTSTARGEFDYASGAYTSVSDGRLKSDITDLHFNWSSFMKLRPTNYSFKSDQVKRKQLGLIAQEVESIYPELVHYNAKEDSYKLDYSGTGVVAIKAVQELKKENDELHKMIQLLMEKVERLESKK